MQTLLGPAKLEGLLRSPSEALAQDLEPASPFANINAVSTFWKGMLTCRGSTAKRRALTHKVLLIVQTLSWIAFGKTWTSKA